MSDRVPAKDEQLAGVAVPRVRGSIYLQPGQLAATAEPTVITTILGSCVAVCLSDLSSGIGGMNHFLLPLWAGTNGPSSARFGKVAIEALIARLVALGCARDRLRAKVFGGACVLRGFQKPAGGHLGEKNSQVAFEELSRHGIPVLAQDIGGTNGRKLQFYTDLGTVGVKRL